MPDPAPFSSRLLFIGGLHKSGTSIFHRCVADHPEISGFSDTGVPRDEGQLLQTVYPAAHVSGGMGRFGFDEAAHLTEESPLVSTGNAEQLLDQWAPYWDLSKSVLVEKSPPTLIRTRFLQALFPEARFVILLRHPIPVSYSTQKWTDIPLHRLVAHWIVCHRLFEEDRSRIRKLRVVRYEDFVEEPERVLREIHQFVGLEPVSSGREIRRNVNHKYLRRWTFHRLRPRAARYRKRILERYGSMVREFDYGYRLDETAWL